MDFQQELQGIQSQLTQLENRFMQHRHNHLDSVAVEPTDVFIFPKDSTKFLDGTGAFSLPPGAGSTSLTSTTGSGASLSLTTTASQTALVFAYGTIQNSVPFAGDITITISYNGVSKNTVVINTNSSSVLKYPFSLFYSDSPGAATHNITVTTSSGTLSGIQYLIIKYT